MSKLSKIAFPLLVAASLFAATASATPTDGTTTWSFGGLYVANYTVYNTGDIGASFETSAGTAFTTWNNSGGVNQCPSNATLHLAPGYAPAPELTKLLLSSALAHKPLHVWFEATAGICYIKQLTATM
jgi:hypothetical protein